MISICQFGAGRIGAVHAANIAANPGTRLGCIVDIDGVAAAAMAARYGAAIGERESALADPAIDAVVIASPTETHAELIIASAAAGKAIFCEKPIDLDIARVAACLARVAAAGVPLAVGFNRRHDPSFQALKRAVESGQIGKLATLHILSRDPAPPPPAYLRKSGGLFRDMMIHDFDMARWLLGEEPVKVYAEASCLVDPAIAAVGDVDTAMVTLATGSGALCHIHNSRRTSFGYDQRIEVFGSGGMLQAGNRYTTTVSWTTEEGRHASNPLGFFHERYREAFAAELDDFAEAVETGRAPLAGGEDGRAALEIADAACRSLSEGGPVRL